MKSSILAAVALLGASVILSSCIGTPSPPTGSAVLPAAPPVTRPQSSGETTAERLLALARQSVFRVRNVDCTATGTSFTVNQGIITNRHVASGAQDLQLATWSGTDFTTQVDSISAGPDLSLMDGQRESTVVPDLASGDPAPGTRVWVAGYPLGDQLTVTTGQIIDYANGSDYNEPGKIAEITDPIQPGNSGSPLLNAEGQVVGVVFAKSNITGIGLAIPVSTLKDYLASPDTNTVGSCA